MGGTRKKQSDKVHFPGSIEIVNIPISGLWYAFLVWGIPRDIILPSILILAYLRQLGKILCHIFLKFPFDKVVIMHSTFASCRKHNIRHVLCLLNHQFLITTYNFEWRTLSIVWLIWIFVHEQAWFNRDTTISSYAHTSFFKNPVIT